MKMYVTDQILYMILPYYEMANVVHLAKSVPVRKNMITKRDNPTECLVQAHNQCSCFLWAWKKQRLHVKQPIGDQEQKLADLFWNNRLSGLVDSVKYALFTRD